MFGKTGVLVLSIPVEGIFDTIKLERNDVILKVIEKVVKNVTEFRSEVKNNEIKTIAVWRNQSEIQL